jgi:hypothetical protein
MGCGFILLGIGLAMDILTEIIGDFVGACNDDFNASLDGESKGKVPKSEFISDRTLAILQLFVVVAIGTWWFSHFEGFTPVDSLCEWDSFHLARFGLTFCHALSNFYL